MRYLKYLRFTIFKIIKMFKTDILLERNCSFPEKYENIPMTQLF